MKFKRGNAFLEMKCYIKLSNEVNVFNVMKYIN